MTRQSVGIKELERRLEAAYREVGLNVHPDDWSHILETVLPELHSEPDGYLPVLIAGMVPGCRGKCRDSGADPVDARRSPREPRVVRLSRP